MGVTSKDNGYADLIKRVIGMKPVTVRVGILEKDGGAAHGDDDATLIAVAAWNHFGVLAKNGEGWHIPPRPFITDFVDKHEAEIRQKLVVLMQSVVKGERTREQALDAIGAWCAGQIQQEVADGVPPPNAASTVREKGSSTPLVDTGQLRSSISFDVVE